MTDRFYGHGIVDDGKKIAKKSTSKRDEFHGGGYVSVVEDKPKKTVAKKSAKPGATIKGVHTADGKTVKVKGKAIVTKTKGPIKFSAKTVEEAPVKPKRSHHKAKPVFAHDFEADDKAFTAELLNEIQEAQQGIPCKVNRTGEYSTLELTATTDYPWKDATNTVVKFAASVSDVIAKPTIVKPMGFWRWLFNGQPSR